MEIKKCQNTPAFKANLGKINTRKIYNLFGQEGLDIVERFMHKVVEKDFLDATSTVHISAFEDDDYVSQMKIICEKRFVPSIEKNKGLFNKIKNRLINKTKFESDFARVGKPELKGKTFNEQDELMVEAAKKAHGYCMDSDIAEEFADNEKAKEIRKLQK